MADQVEKVSAVIHRLRPNLNQSNSNPNYRGYRAPGLVLITEFETGKYRPCRQQVDATRNWQLPVNLHGVLCYYRIESSGTESIGGGQMHIWCRRNHHSNPSLELRRKPGRKQMILICFVAELLALEISSNYNTGKELR